MFQAVVHSRWVSSYGNLLILLLLCGYYSAATLEWNYPVSPRAARQLAAAIAELRPGARVLVATAPGTENAAFAAAASEALQSHGVQVLDVIAVHPAELESRLRELAGVERQIDFVLTHQAMARLPVLSPEGLRRLGARQATLAELQVASPAPYRWPTFLKAGNLRSIVNNIAIIAIIAIGMTMVIVTAGIDLSVGSLIALAGVVIAVCLRKFAGASEPSVWLLVSACAVAIGVCALIGLFSGAMFTLFNIPSFIVTLAVMQMVRGCAFLIAGGPTPLEIHSTAFQWLGNGTLLGVPNPVWIMLGLYVAAHVLMTHTTLGRYIYAVGGNAEASRLSGVPVQRVLLFTYLTCGALAGVAGVLDASLFSVGRAVAGTGYELQIIAAVVVGGASLSGGEGKIFGTLVGALILSVIRNGMILTEVDAYTQLVVFGLLILGAVLLDKLKSRHLHATLAA